MKRKIDVVSLKMLKEKNLEYTFETVKKPVNAVKLVKELIGEVDREYVVVLNLNTKLEPNSIEICGIGSLSESMIHPREIFKSAVLSSAGGIIMVHTHPSGSVEPSPDDILTTQRIRSAGEILGIPLLDHIIIGDGASYYSLSENGYFHEKVQI